MPRFLTIFPNAENVHLIKDVGMIPYILHNKYKYDATIASYKNGEYPYFETEVKGLKQIFIDRRFKSEILNVCLFVLINFRKYDIIQCYHISKNSIIYLLFFKFLKLITFSHGVTYLKFDLNDSIRETGLSKKVVFLLKRIKILSVETKILYEYLNSDNLLKGLVNYIPNGYYHSKNKKKVDFSFKENIIITVGRIGSPEKNNEVLLESFRDFAKINSEWKLELIGPLENGFQVYIDDYFKINPNLISRVVFTGNISDRKLLQEKYRKAKVFVLTSQSESFGIALVEALASGCFILSTDFSSAYEITDNERYGWLFRYGDRIALTTKMLEIVNNQEKLKEECLNVQNFADTNFSWEKICYDINKLVCNKNN